MNDSIHRINEISAVNPELASLVAKVQVIHVVTGGSISKKADSKKVSKYSALKYKINGRLDNVANVQERLESGLYEKDSRDFIALKNALRTEYTELSKDVAEFSKMSEKKTDPTDVEEFKKIIERVKVVIPKHRQQITDSTSDGTSDGIFHTMDDLYSGKVAMQRQEQITMAQQEVITEIQHEQKVQDELIDEMSSILANLNNLASNIKDTIEVQNAHIEVIIQNTDNATVQVDRATEGSKNILKKINSKSTKLCTYIICIVILFALSSIIYNMVA